MVSKIYAWFSENITPRAPASLVPATVDQGRENPTGLSMARFELYETSENNTVLLCPRASLTQKAAGSHYQSSAKAVELFLCHCTPTPGDTDHKRKVAAYGLSPLSFSARLAGRDMSWLLYKVSNKITNQLSSIVIKGVPPEGESQPCMSPGMKNRHH